MRKKWINIVAACGVAVTFAAGCTSTRKQPPKPPVSHDILRNRDLVPPPYSSPDAVRGLTPPPVRPAGASAPVQPGNFVFNNDVQQPAIQTFVPPQQDASAVQQPVTNSSNIISLFPTLENADGTNAVITPPPAPSTTQQVSLASPSTPVKPFRPAPAGIQKTNTPLPPPASSRTVKVVSGDTLSGIAYKYNVRTDTTSIKTQS